MQGDSDVYIWKAKARRPTISAGLDTAAKHPAPSLPDSGEGSAFSQFLVRIDRHFRPFLTGSGSQTEFDVTHSKQTTAQFLTGARTHIKESECRSGFSPLFAAELVISLARRS